MRRIFLTSLFSSIALFASAQQSNNVLINAEYWKKGPSIENIKEEIAKGNSFIERTSNNMDAVVIAILNNGPIESIKYLIDQNIDSINKPTHDGRSYLNWASMRANEPLIKYLIDKGAEINFIDAHGSTPLTALANAANDNLPLYDYLIAKGANIKYKNKEGASSILLAAQKDKNNVLTNYLITKGLNINEVDAQGNNIFYYAAKGGNIEMMKYLLKAGIKNDPEALLAAAQGGRGTVTELSVFEYLTSLKDTDVKVKDKTGNNVLHVIAKKPKQANVLSFFMNKGVDINALDMDGNTPFLNAAAAGDLEMIQLLLPKVKDINHQNKQGNAALSLAIKNNSADIVKLLLEKGAKTDIMDKQGNNLNYYLVESYKPKTKKDFDVKIDLLKNKGFNIQSFSKNENTILHYAIGTDDQELVNKLLASKIDINHKNTEGLTVLHKAAMVANNDALLKLLIEKGADKKIKTNFDETAFDIASENEHIKKQNVSIEFLK